MRGQEPPSTPCLLLLPCPSGDNLHIQGFVSRLPVLVVASRIEEKKNKHCLGALEAPLKTSAFRLSSPLPPRQPVLWCLCIQRRKREKTISRRRPASHAPFCPYSCSSLTRSYEPKGQGCPNPISLQNQTPWAGKKEKRRKKKRGASGEEMKEDTCGFPFRLSTVSFGGDSF